MADDTVTPAGPITYGPATPTQADANRATIQAAIDHGVATGRTTLIPRGEIHAPGLLMRGEMRLRGEHGAILVGAPGTPALTIDVRPGRFWGGRIDSIEFRGNQGPAVEKIGDAQAPTYTYWTDCRFTSYTHAAFLWHGAGSEQYFTRCVFQGGPYGFQTDFRPPTPGALDSFQFVRCNFGGQSLARFTTRNSSGWLFDRCAANTFPRHGWIIENLGGLTGWQWRDTYANEGACHEGAQARVTTTAAATAGARTFRLAATTNAGGAGITVGDVLTVEAAGPDGGLYEGVVTAVDKAALTVTTDTPAGTTTTGAWATNARYDVIHVEGRGAGNVGSFENCAFNQGSGSNVRFGVNAAPNLVMNSVIPIWDKYLTGTYVRSTAPMTRPGNGVVPGAVIAPIGKTGALPVRASMSAPPGGDYVIGLEGAGANYAGPYGAVEVHRRGARVLRVTAGGDVDAAGGIRPGAVPVLPAPTEALRGRILRVEGAAGDSVHVCVRTAGGGHAWVRLA